ncbi:putative protein TPLATE [Helianthus anomalus]
MRRNALMVRSLILPVENFRATVPNMIFEVGINMLYLVDVPGSKPEWTSASIIAILTLWDRQEFSSARKGIVGAVVVVGLVGEERVEREIKKDLRSDVLYIF